MDSVILALRVLTSRKMSSGIEPQGGDVSDAGLRIIFLDYIMVRKNTTGDLAGISSADRRWICTTLLATSVQEYAPSRPYPVLRPAHPGPVGNCGSESADPFRCVYECPSPIIT